MYDRFLMNLANGFMSTSVLYTACELNIFDLLANQPSNLEDIAEQSYVKKELLLKILRPLIAYNLVIANVNGTYDVTKIGRQLTSGAPNSLKAYILFTGRESVKLWQDLYPSFLKNVSPYQLQGGKGIFEANDMNNERLCLFEGMMQTVSNTVELTSFFQKAFSSNAPEHIVDIGGGTGTILSKFLEYFPVSQGTLLDLPQVEESAQLFMTERGLEKRYLFQQGSFFEELNLKGDIYILSRVLHDWSDDEAIHILTVVFKTMPPNSKLLIIENVLPKVAEKQALDAYMNDLQMWAFFGSSERTEEEFYALFRKVNFQVERQYVLNQKSSVRLFMLKKMETEEGMI